MHLFISVRCCGAARTENFRGNWECSNLNFSKTCVTGPRSAVDNVSGNRSESDCRSRGLEFDPGQTHTFVGIDH